MNPIHVVTLLAAASALAGCKTRTFGDNRQNEAKDSSAQGEGKKRKLSGAELWDITEKNIWNGRAHTIIVRMNESVYQSLKNDEMANGCKGNFDVKWGHVREFRFDDQVLNNVAVKIRGNTSRCIPRPQFAVKFNKDSGVSKKNWLTEDWTKLEYPEDVKKTVKNQTLFGLESLSLRRSNNDSSSNDEARNGILSREFVSSWAFQQAEKVAPTTSRGAPVYRVGYAIVEFRLCNGDGDKECGKVDRQIYNVTENIDKQFIKMRWDDADGTLIQGDKACGFKEGKDFSTFCYSTEFIDGEKFDDEDKESLAKAKDVVEGPEGLITRLKSAKTASEIESIIDVNSFFNYMVAATTVGHWDSAYGNFNNDLVYFEPKSGKWKMVTWDLDNTLDYDQKGKPDAGYRYDKVAGARRVLFDTIFDNAELHERFKQHLNRYLDAVYNSKGDGPISLKIVEARDEYIAKLNPRTVFGQGVDPALAQEMFDYTKTRYFSLKKQIGK